MFDGSYVAIVTPFKNDKIDEKSLKDLIEFQISSGTSGIVPCGTTGESATMTIDEHEELINLVVSYTKKRVPVIAGTGSNSTSEAIILTKHAEAAGADAALLITPYYNKPSQEGLYQHYKKVAQSVNIPIVLYNVPGRTSVNMLPETVARLSEIDNITAIKEASGSVEQASNVIELCKGRLKVISGDDANTLPLMAVGASSVISVTANIMPKEVAKLCSLFKNGDLSAAQKLHIDLLNINQIMFCDTNPVPVKAALSLMGKISDEIRLPLTKLSEANLNLLKGVLNSYGLIHF